MKTSLHSTIAAFGLAIFNVSVDGEDYTYTTNNGTIAITKYTGSSGDVTIPNEIHNLPVTSIAHGTFFSCTNVVTIAIPDTVTNIVGVVFSGCTALTAFNVAPQNPAFCSLDGVLYNKTRTALLRCPQVKAGSYTVPNTVTTIASYAFNECTGLIGVTLPNTVTTIGMDAFFWCTSLASITIPPGVSRIEPWTFGYGRSLTNLTILGSVTNIGNWAFYSTRLCTLTLPDTLITIDTGAFSSTYFLTNVTFGRGLTSIGASAFSGAYDLTAAYFRGNAPTPGRNVFGGADLAIAYYLPGTTGWEPTFAGLPTALWLPQIQTRDPGFGIRTDTFGFNVAWTEGRTVVIEASPALSNPTWFPISTTTFTTDSFYFSDPEWMNYPSRFYRVRGL